MNKYIVYFVLTVSQYIMDRSTSSCMTNSGETLLLFHHFFAIYLYLGSFFFDPFIHLIVATLTIIHWYTYGKCILTQYTNIYCGVDIDRPFHDYIRMLELYKIIPKIHWVLLLMLIIYDLCLIVD